MDYLPITISKETGLFPMCSIKQEWREICRTWEQVSCQQNVPSLCFFYIATCRDGPKLNALLSQVFLKAALRQVTSALTNALSGAFVCFKNSCFAFENLDLREWELPKNKL